MELFNKDGSVNNEILKRAAKNKPPKDDRPIKTYTKNGIDYVEYPNDMDEYNVLLKLLEESLKE